jgi:general secretion pathway protein M
MALSQGFQRCLAVALLALLLALVWRTAVRPLWQQWTHNEQLIEQQRSTIDRLSAMAASRDRYAQALNEMRARSGVDDALMKSGTVTLAAAQLQRKVKSLVESVGGSVVSAQAKDGADEGPFARVQLDVRLSVSNIALQKVMHALETQRPIVIIEELLILAKRRRNKRAASADEMLDVRVSIAGFVARTSKAGGA